MKRIYLPLFAGLLLAACSKHNTDNTRAAPPDQQSATDVRDQFEALNLLNTFTNGASILQAEIASAKTTGTTLTPGSPIVTGYDFNGAELGKPEDLFCGAAITGGENTDNYTVNVSYNGPDCAGLLFLKGTVIISIPKFWGWDAIHKGLGFFFVDLNKLQVTRIIDNTHTYLTGILTITNFGYLSPNDPHNMFSISELVKKKDPDGYVDQGISNYSYYDSISIHYDDGAKTNIATNWQKRFTWKDQVVIGSSGYLNTRPNPFWAAAGITRHGRPFHWTAPHTLWQYQNCGYKTNGLMYCVFDDNYPGKDSISIVFGTDARGTQAPAAVWKGTQCLDKAFLHLTTWHQNLKTLDLVLPE